MASMLKLLFVFLCLVFFIEGGMAESRQCTISDISITQQQIPGPEFVVAVSNNCECAQFSLVVACPGFNPGNPQDIRWIQSLGNGDCLINSGYAIIQGYPVIFIYGSTSQLSFTPKTSDIRC